MNITDVLDRLHGDYDVYSFNDVGNSEIIYNPSLNSMLPKITHLLKIPKVIPYTAKILLDNYIVGIDSGDGCLVSSYLKGRIHYTLGLIEIIVLEKKLIKSKVLKVETLHTIPTLHGKI